MQLAVPRRNPDARRRGCPQKVSPRAGLAVHPGSQGPTLWAPRGFPGAGTFRVSPESPRRQGQAGHTSSPRREWDVPVGREVIPTSGPSQLPSSGAGALSSRFCPAGCRRGFRPEVFTSPGGCRDPAWGVCACPGAGGVGGSRSALPSRLVSVCLWGACMVIPGATLQVVEVSGVAGSVPRGEGACPSPYFC